MDSKPNCQIYLQMTNPQMQILIRITVFTKWTCTETNHLYKFSKKILQHISTQKSRSNIVKMQIVQAFTVTHTPTELHHFLISSFRHTDTHTDRQN